jgi:hypothetical protein
MKTKVMTRKGTKKLVLNILKVMGGLTPIYTTFGDLVQRSFHRSFHVYTNQGSFLKNFLINSELKDTKT